MKYKKGEIVEFYYLKRKALGIVLEDYPKPGKNSLFVDIRFFHNRSKDGIFCKYIINNFGKISKEEFIEKYPEKSL